MHHVAYAVIAIIMIYMERKVCAAFQCRLGPMRVGPQWGCYKCLPMYQDVDKGNHHHSKDSDQFLYNLAPFIGDNRFYPDIQMLAINKGWRYLTSM